MKKIIESDSIVLGDNVDTDQIYPGKYLAYTDPDIIGKHCLEGYNKNIVKNFKKGNIIIAGKNFGCGSSREHAPISILNMGASIIIAESFARIFYRNSINLGLPVIICKNIKNYVNTGDRLKVDLSKGVVLNKSSGQILKCEKIDDFIFKILSSGGVKNIFKEKDNLYDEL